MDNEIKQQVLAKLMVLEAFNYRIDDKHLDSFWYDKEVACLKYKDRLVYVEACGDIRIHNKEGELVHDGYKDRNSGFKFKLDDDDLKKIGNNYDDEYYWENNNWFEIVGEKGGTYFEELRGEVYDDLDNALKDAREIILDDKLWK